MIELRNISYILEEKKILKDINIKLTHKKTGIIGANGSGKSTLLRLIKGLLNPTKGNILINGIDITQDKNLKKQIGFMFQNPDSQIVFPNVEEDIIFGLKNFGLTKEEIKSKLNTILQTLNLEKLKNSLTYKLSGGEKQMIALAGILIMNPKYILFDEPTTFLDLRNKAKIFNIINSLDQYCILATHDLDFLKNFDTVIVMDNGKILLEDEPKLAINKYKQMIL